MYIQHFFSKLIMILRRRIAIFSLFAISGGFTLSVFADTQPQTPNLILTATLVNSGCVTSMDSKSITVDMKTVAVKDFSLHKQPLPIRFAINLEKCTVETTGVVTTFSGTADANDNTLLALNGGSTAKNVGIAILDNQGNRIPINQASTFYPLKISSNMEKTSLVFYGQYVATGEVITPGIANADATFTFEYQ